MKKIAMAVAAVSVLGLSGVASADEMQDLATAKGCLGCHSVDAKIVGPAYKDVAAKYKGDASAEDKLAKKVVDGGVGVWGDVPMPPNASVTPEEAKKLVHWVLSH